MRNSVRFDSAWNGMVVSGAVALYEQAFSSDFSWVVDAILRCSVLFIPQPSV